MTAPFDLLRLQDNKPARAFLTLGALVGLAALVAGAFGLHVLKSRLGAESLHTFETGARYQMFNAFAVMVAGFIALLKPSKIVRGAGIALIVGTVLFSGTLYALALSGAHGLHFIMPFAGVSLVTGWSLLALACYRD